MSEKGKSNTVRQFDTGATRSPLGDKLQYEGYLNPLVLKRYAEYMQKHQTQSDGTRRSADNWQKNIDIESLCDSKVRHDMDSWLYFRGYSSETSEEIEDTLCACIFNTMAILKQVLEKRGRGKIPGEKEKRVEIDRGYNNSCWRSVFASANKYNDRDKRSGQSGLMFNAMGMLFEVLKAERSKQCE